MTSNLPIRRAGAALLLAALTAPAHAQQQPNSGVSLGPSQNASAGRAGGDAARGASVRRLGRRADLCSAISASTSRSTSPRNSPATSAAAPRRAPPSPTRSASQADIDWEKLAGIPGFSTHAVVVNRSGSSDSAVFGDHINAVQEIYGGGGNVVAHLVYFYGEESLDGGRIDIAAGRIPVLNDFAASTLYCDFMNVSICGNPGSLGAGDIGLSVFPDATWGGRVRVRPVAQTYVQVGAYEVSQGLFKLPYFRSGWNFDTSLDSGVEVPVEIGYEPQIGPDKMPGHYKLGFGWDSSSYKDLYLDANGNPSLASGQPFASHRGRFRFWALADQMLLRNGSGDDAGLILLGAYVHGDPATTVYENQYTAGLLDTGFWQARPQDTIGALFTYQEVSGQLGKQQALQQEFGLPLARRRHRHPDLGDDLRAELRHPRDRRRELPAGIPVRGAAERPARHPRRHRVRLQDARELLKPPARRCHSACSRNCVSLHRRITPACSAVAGKRRH